MPLLMFPIYAPQASGFEHTALAVMVPLGDLYTDRSVSVLCLVASMPLMWAWLWCGPKLQGTLILCLSDSTKWCRSCLGLPLCAS